MKRAILASILFLTILLTGASSAFADRDLEAYASNPPAEVISHIEESWPTYELEDYILIDGTSKGDYGFALVEHNGDRKLLGYHAENAHMHPWLLSHDAAPQGEGYAGLARNTPFSEDYDGNALYQDDLGFHIWLRDLDNAEYWNQFITFHWEDGSFKLYEYQDWAGSRYVAYVSRDKVSFVDFMNDGPLGSVKGALQRELQYVRFSALPQDIAEAKHQLSAVNAIPAGDLSARSILLTGGKTYAVYAAPSETSLRGAKGKAAVSTNDWIQVFGEDGGFALIQYAISKTQMRIGYIKAEALEGAMNAHSLTWRNEQASLLKDVNLTDDPLKSKAALIKLKKGLPVTLLAMMGDWAYIEADTGSGQVRGFVKANVLK